jgi:hypothetical protein
MLQVRERAPTPSPSTIFTFEFVIESIKELGVRHPLFNGQPIFFGRQEKEGVSYVFRKPLMKTC